MADLHNLSAIDTEEIRMKSAKIIEIVRETFLNETEKLADLALENGQFTLVDMA